MRGRGRGLGPDGAAGMVGQLTGVVVAAAAGPAGEDLAPAFERAKPRYLTRRLKTLVHGAGAFPICAHKYRSLWRKLPR